MKLGDRAVADAPAGFDDLLIVESQGLAARSDRGWALTERGRALEPVVLALGAFGAQWMGSADGHHTSGRWFVVSLQRRYQGGVEPTTVNLTIDDVPYRLTVTPEVLESRDGSHAAPDLTLSGSLPDVAAALRPGGAPTATMDVIGDEARLAALGNALP